MNVSKKIFMGLIYIYISIAALSAENIIGVGLSFPIQNFSNYKSYTEELTGHGYAYGKAGSGSLSDTDLAGYQVAFNFKHIFDNKFALGGSFGIGTATLKFEGDDDYEDLADFSLDLSLGYAVVNSERVTLILSGIGGWRYAFGGPQEAIVLYNGNLALTDAYTTVSTFNIGAEVFANFKLGEKAGLFASCKVTRGVGDLKGEYEDWNGNTLTATQHDAAGVCITPSFGFSLKI